MSPNLTDSRLANMAAGAILRSFDDFQARFGEITRRACTRFETRDWPGLRRDALGRLDLYRDILDVLVAEVRDLLGERIQEKLVWAGMKAVTSGLIAGREDWDLAETFFNSVTRRIFATVGVDAGIEFVDTDFEAPPTTPRPVARAYRGPFDAAGLLRRVLADLAPAVTWQDRARDIDLAARAVADRLQAANLPSHIDRAEFIESVFYRGQAAYVVGRLHAAGRLMPLVVALRHPVGGLVLDAVLLDEDDVSILFSFARSYFQVEVGQPYGLVEFLRSIMPRKRAAELYISLGYNTHGKTLLYRDLLHQLREGTGRFEHAPGERGLVMTVFRLPGFDQVFKVVRDHFGYPKRTTRPHVFSRYRLVFQHDRAGRLLDTQAFEHLEFARDRFAPALREELLREAGRTVEEIDGRLVVHHCWVERQVTPLDIYLREADPAQALAAVIDYGRAIKDLAQTNIFPGDLLLKNFGVTRHGRVVCYDYDEVILITECHFRRLPPPRSPEEELSPEPYFAVQENDVFPEEFGHFLGLPARLREAFLAEHGDLLDVEYWRERQRALREGRSEPFWPYPPQERLQGKARRGA
jgi:isocitrate dehydrogenase kinase/phosphatase